MLERVGTIEVGHLEVEQDDIGVSPLHEHDAGFAIACNFHRKASRFELHAVHLADGLVVFDDGNFNHLLYNSRCSMKMEQNHLKSSMTPTPAEPLVALGSALARATDFAEVVAAVRTAVEAVARSTWCGVMVTVDRAPPLIDLPDECATSVGTLLPLCKEATVRTMTAMLPKRHALRRYNIAVVLRLVWQGNHCGYIVLGPPAGRATYTTAQRAALAMIAQQCAVTLMAQQCHNTTQQFQQQLTQAVDHATRQLRASNRRLRELDAAKDEFVSMASHQLRTPLTSVKGYISMVLEGDAGEINATQRTFLTEAFTSSERMVQLIGNFLNVSRIRTGNFTIDFRLGDVAALVAQSIESIQLIAERHHLRVDYQQCGVIPPLLIDENKLRQVIVNYIDNAIYYSPGADVITVRLYHKDGWVVCTVQDNGIGVPQGEQRKIFTKFFRAHNAQLQRPDGTGIGLFLAKKIVLGHHGELIFHSREGQGSTFGFRLPIDRLTPHQNTSPNENHSPRGK